MNASVLVVGAGPAGLLVASELKKYGINVKIIDKGLDNSKYSKALSVNAASLKLFHGLGFSKNILSKGKVIHDVQIFYNKSRTVRIRKRYLDSLYNYYLSIPQPETEYCLEFLLKEQGVTVDYGKELIDLRQDKKGVYVQIANQLDKKANISYQSYDYVVGCDGANSRVRQLLAIPFEGKDYDMHFVMGDVYFDRDIELKETSYHITDEGFMIVLPMANGLIRLVIKKDGPLPASRPKPTLNELQDYLNKFYIEKLTIKELVWSSSAQFFNRLAETNHCGRVFLAGDSYHLFSPIGGQGMNTGLQDAMNLSWKLAYNINGYVSNNMLDSYFSERYNVIKKVLSSTDLNTNIISGKELLSSKRNIFMPSMKNRAFYREDLPLEFSGLTADYSHNGEFTGRHVPYFKLHNLVEGISDSYEIPKLGKNLLFLNNVFSAKFLEKYSKVISVIYTQDKNIIKRLNLENLEVCLIRPDGYIGYHGNIKNLESYLNKYYNRESLLAAA